MTLRSFSDWEAEYEGYDWPSLLAEAGAMGDIEPFNRLAAMFARLVDVACGEPALTIADTSRAIRLARAMAQTLRDMTAADPAMRARFELAFEANIDWASKFSAFPENAALIAAS